MVSSFKLTIVTQCKSHKSTTKILSIADQTRSHTTVTLEYHHDEVEFADEVREHVKQHAKKSREQWREELIES